MFFILFPQSIAEVESFLPLIASPRWGKKKIPAFQTSGFNKLDLGWHLVDLREKVATRLHDSLGAGGEIIFPFSTESLGGETPRDFQ